MLSRKAQAHAATTALCNFCVAKSRTPGHDYCSKLCAGRASLLCEECKRRQKRPGFNYCSRGCAAQSKPTGPSRVVSSRSQNSANSYLTAVNSTSTGSAVKSKPLPQPPKNGGAILKGWALLSAAARGKNNTAAPPMVPAKSRASSNGSQRSKSTNATLQDECIIPGCGQPVYVNKDGTATDYCSMQHREEAVNLGIDLPCIVCQVRPQTDRDYFCGRICRDEALRKP